MQKAAKIFFYISGIALFISVIYIFFFEFQQGFFTAISSRVLPASLLQEVPSTFADISEEFSEQEYESLKDFQINAKAAACIEINQIGQNDIVFSYNEKEVFPIASLTKLMTAVIVLENYDSNKVTVISKEVVDQVGTQGLLSLDEMLSLKNLLYIMLVESSNDAAYSLAEIMGLENFVDLMNEKAKEIGLLETNFEDPTGLGPKNVSNVEDLVKLTIYISENHPEIWQISILNNYRLLNAQGKLHHVLSNTNDLLEKFPNIVGSKTGKTAEAKGCLLLIVKDQQTGRNAIYILLGSDDRFGEMQRLINRANL